MKTQPTSDITTQWQLHFGDNAADAKRVLSTIKNAPTRVWRAEGLIEATGLTPMTLLMILARLTYLELIAHPELGAYAALAAPVTSRAPLTA